MEEQNLEVIQNEKNVIKSFDDKHFRWFFNNYDEKKRKTIFDLIYESLFIDEKEDDMIIEDLFTTENLNEFILTEDNKYNQKSNNEILELFLKEEKQLNEKLSKYKIKISIINETNLCLEDFDRNSCIEILCLRNVRFGEKFEWICNANYLLYFQYFVLNYIKPSRVNELDEDNNEKVETIDSYNKAEKILSDIYFIYIKDSEKKNFDLKQIFKDGNDINFFDFKENIFKYLDYNKNDPKQIEGSNKTNNFNYKSIINFSYSNHFNNLIYSFHNGYYFFEINLIKKIWNFYITKYKKDIFI